MGANSVSKIGAFTASTHCGPRGTGPGSSQRASGPWAWPWRLDHSPGFGATDQAGMQRVALDISQDHQQMVIILDRKSLESALPDVPRRVVMALIAADVRGQQPVHPATEIAVSQGTCGAGHLRLREGGVQNHE